MIKPNQKILLKWNASNKTYFIDKGYTFTKMGEEFEVDAEDISHGSKTNIVVLCEYCGTELTVPAYSYYNSIKASGSYCCSKCKWIKVKTTNRERYGVDNPMQNEDVRVKNKQSLFESFGVVHPSQSKALYKKSLEAKLEKYGDEKFNNREKAKETCLKNHGVENASVLEETIAKMKATCVEKYGGESSQCDVEVRQKSWDTMLENGTTPSSKPEKAMVELLKEIYGADNCKAQYVFDRCSFDCLLSVNGVDIDVEYDGKYWHNEERDTRRDNYTIRRGIKVLRFVSEIAVPSKDLIIRSVDYLVNSNHTHIKVDVQSGDII